MHPIDFVFMLTYSRLRPRSSVRFGRLRFPLVFRTLVNTHSSTHRRLKARGMSAMRRDEFTSGLRHSIDLGEDCQFARLIE